MGYALARAGLEDKARAMNNRAQADNGQPPIPILLASNDLALGDEASALTTLDAAAKIVQS